MTKNFNFIASDKLDLKSFENVGKFVDDFPDFQTVVINDENELKLLLELMGIHDIVPNELKTSEFSKLWDLSSYKLPELSNEQFDQFYSTWIQKSNRSNNMDEYGNLIFLQGLSSKWNKMNYRLVVKENN
jgi:hypothetical protein